MPRRSQPHVADSAPAHQPVAPRGPGPGGFGARPPFVPSPAVIAPPPHQRGGKAAAWFLLLCIVGAGATAVYLLVIKDEDSGTASVSESAATFVLDEVATTPSGEPVASTDAPRILDEACLLEQRSIEMATEAWYAMNGSATPPTEAQLVSDGLLRSESTLMDLVDGRIVGAPGTRCE